MDKIAFIGLWDIYKGLLTKTQQEITDMYFNLDLTLSEIAEQKCVSRQAVSECLKTCKSQLEEYESKLHIRERLTEISLDFSFMVTDVGKWAEEFKKSHPEFSTEADKLLGITNKDYTEEVARALKKKN